MCQWDLEQKVKAFLFTFKNISWKPGTISAIGYDKSGKQICTTKIITAGKPAALAVKSNHSSKWCTGQRA